MGESISLYYREGSSDKEYHARIEPQNGGFVVHFAYGRRGSTLQTGTKTPAPVSQDEAKRIYDKLVGEKMAKGYTPGESGTPYQATTKEERATGIFPQLLNAITEDEANALVENHLWGMQPKYDGKRILIRGGDGKVEAINRKGLIVALPDSIVGDAQKIRGQFLIDGECLGDKYMAFDILEHLGKPVRGLPYIDRVAKLAYAVPLACASITIAPLWVSAAEKRKMLKKCRKDRAEGVVFKHLDSAYVPGRPSTGGPALKLKFTASATCKVGTITKAKRSVGLLLFDGKKAVDVGKVTIPANHAMPTVGTAVEVRYLYAIKGGSLYQPVYLGARDDVDSSACVLSQLKYKAEGEEEA